MFLSYLNFFRSTFSYCCIVLSYFPSSTCYGLHISIDDCSVRILAHCCCMTLFCLWFRFGYLTHSLYLLSFFIPLSFSSLHVFASFLIYIPNFICSSIHSITYILPGFVSFIAQIFQTYILRKNKNILVLALFFPLEKSTPIRFCPPC